MFDGGELRLVLLNLIAEQPRHGYDLIRAVDERTDGAYAPSPGVVYPTLTLLSDMGLIHEQASDGPRKLFELTDDGARHLAEHEKEAAMLLARLDAVGEKRGSGEAVPVRRAMHNLRNVLAHRLTDGLGEESLYEAVALIDEVARKIERL